MTDLITEARELIENLHTGGYDNEHIEYGAYEMLLNVCDALEKAETRIELLENAIERQNRTISYLSNTKGDE